MSPFHKLCCAPSLKKWKLKTAAGRNIVIYFSSSVALSPLFLPRRLARASLWHPIFQTVIFHSAGSTQREIELLKYGMLMRFLRAFRLFYQNFHRCCWDWFCIGRTKYGYTFELLKVTVTRLIRSCALKILTLSPAVKLQFIF